MILSFLRGPSLIVESGGVRSMSRQISSGVPQGSILTPLLFSLFINYLSLSLRDSKVHFYADNLQIYLSGRRGDLGRKGEFRTCGDINWSQDNGFLRGNHRPCLLSTGIPLEIPLIYYWVLSQLIGVVVWRIRESLWTNVWILVDMFPRSVPKFILLYIVFEVSCSWSIWCQDKSDWSSVNLWFTFLLLWCSLEEAFNSYILYVFNIWRFDHICFHRKVLIG
jgi:Reverse transcriptase (RNA-dependent DNA polymerase)